MGSEKRLRPDWEAIERDFRTGKFTLRELETKHGVSYAHISRKAKEHGWKKDLRQRIKEETDAALLREAVTEQQKDVTETVAVAVETNLRVIRGHKELLVELLEDLRDARSKLKQVEPKVSDVREAAIYAQARTNLAGITKTLIEQERKAFGLDDDSDKNQTELDALLARINASAE